MSISLIIPTYNRKTKLSRAIESVFKGVLLPREVIVVDDGSTDGTYEQYCTDSRLTVIQTDHKGVSAARNRGIHEARGEWICFLDSDDEWLPNKLERQLAHHKRYPDHLISQTEEIWIRHGVRVNPLAKHKKRAGDIFIPSLRLCLITPSSVMIHRRVFDEVGVFDESLPVCEDYDLWLRITERYEIGLVDEKLLVRYGGHEDQLSSSERGLDRYRIQALEKMLSRELSSRRREALVDELMKKCHIYAKGCLKRRKMLEAKQYIEKIDQLKEMQWVKT